MRQAPAYGRLRHLAPTQGYQALLASPLRGSGDLAGVIVAYSVTARQFSGPELELIELLGGQAAMALETARLRAEQQEVIRELSLANDELRRGRAVLEWAERQHHQLMQLVLDEGGLPELARALAAALRASVTVEDTDGRVLASAPAEGYCPPPAPAARRARAARAALKAQEASGRRYTVARVPVMEPNGPGGEPGRLPGAAAAWAAPVVVGGELAGRLWVTAPPADPEPVQLRVVERFALAVALVMLQQRHLLDVQSRLSGDLLGDLLKDGGPVRPRAVFDRAAAIGDDLSRPHALALLTVGRHDPGRRPSCGAGPGRGRAGPAPLVGPYDGAYVLLLPVERCRATRCAASWPRPARRWARGGWSPWSPGRWPAIRPTTRPRSGSPGRGGAAPRQRPGRFRGRRPAWPVRAAARDGDAGRAQALRRHRAPGCGGARGTLRQGTCWPRCGPGFRPAARPPRRRTPSSCTAIPSATGSAASTLTGRTLRDSSVRLELQLALTIREIARLGTPG